MWTVHTYAHARTFTQSVHLVLTDPVAHLGLLECEKPPLQEREAAVVRVLAVDPWSCSKRCQSAAAVLHAWERQDSRADFSVFFNTSEGSACQHSSAQWHLKAVDSLFITASRTACFGKDMFCGCVFVYHKRTDCYQRGQIQINDLWFYKKLSRAEQCFSLILWCYHDLSHYILYSRSQTNPKLKTHKGCVDY